MAFQEKLLRILTKEQVLIKEPMSRHTTFRVGGAAEYYLKPTEEQLPQVMALCRAEQLPILVVGNGSNLLVGDKGIAGVVLEIGTWMSKVQVEDGCIYAQAGATLAKVAQDAAKAGLAGLEFASGIPGTVGGAVNMNAGAYGGEIKDVLKWARVLCKDGEIKTYTGEELELSYRHSILPQIEGVVLTAAFELTKQEEPLIRQRMEELRQQRVQKQPLEFPSAGSTFKRPEGYYAGKLIMDAGLRGYRVGDAQVSEKHCGFVVNLGEATAADIRKLIEDVTGIVKEKTGVNLEPEVKFVGEF